jgi:hypothetical protein
MDYFSHDFFSKLAFSAPDIDIDVKKLELKGVYDKPTKYSVALSRYVDYTPIPPELYTVNGKDRYKILSVIPKTLIELEEPEVLLIHIPPCASDQGMFAPHVDGFRVASINFYLDSSGEVTTFYKYNKSKLMSVASFCAKKGEWWLLNSASPHSVSLSKDKSRNLISISFVKTKFEHIVATLQSSGSVYV